ncbi:hypothetical protein [Alkalitalea saponilacus]|uniref:Uncharacterized protein n=1 Tax=Alkalitalea saponilacus TaxID=889453 RepID=A0A1T5DX30_9BACT|nr:hypothetical protein [Alkalitalea saponilacus]ASB49156.1 hypothetical protein CDL62_08375 [Alkalitalea saponilacus]SKB76378.1 hypothetical protein SAMN03080601_01157 [Alkalitalea saponilacus]
MQLLINITFKIIYGRVKLLFKSIFFTAVLTLAFQSTYCQSNMIKRSDKTTIRIPPTLYHRNLINNSVNDILIPHIRKDAKYLTDLKECADSASIWKIYINLKSGTSWELNNPPKKPIFIIPRILFKSKNLSVINYTNYAAFAGTCESEKKIPWFLMDNITVVLPFFSNNGEECINIFYELVPDLEDGMKISNIKIEEKE